MNKADRITTPVPRCSDGTVYGECSASRPFYCYAGQLISRCGYCSCPDAYSCEGDGNCIPKQGKEKGQIEENTAGECSYIRDCPQGEVCVEHLCRNVLSCTDSETEQKISVKGAVTVTYSNDDNNGINDIQSFSDYCFNATHLIEVTCRPVEGKVEETAVPCLFSCKEGICSQCGNNLCAGEESCTSCAVDCGNCPDGIRDLGNLDAMKTPQNISLWK